MLRSIEEAGVGFRVATGLLLLVILGGWVIFGRQILYGLGVTGLNQPVAWGFYIVNFVFFIGISHAGTLISAILRLSQAEWRRPDYSDGRGHHGGCSGHRSLSSGARSRSSRQSHEHLHRGPPAIAIALGRQLDQRLLHGFDGLSLHSDDSRYRHLAGPGCLATLVLLFRLLGVAGNARQHAVLERAVSIMMVLVIPIAVSVHTVISYIFAMTLQPAWHSTIFGPYFVVGAIFSGIAALMMVMIVLRRVFHLERYLKQIHFDYLSRLLLIMSLLWFYFTFSEFLTAFFGNEPSEMRVFYYKFSGPYAPFFWGMVICNFLIPTLILSFKKTRTIPGIFIASTTIVIGMWLERLNIVVPSLANPRLPLPSGYYIPSLVEWAMFAGGIATFMLGFVVFARFFPLISIWEIQEGREVSVRETAARLESYLPDPEPATAASGEEGD